MAQTRELKPYQREVVRRQAMGQRSREIGAALGMTASNIRMIWRKPEAKEYLAQYLKMIDLVSGLALKTLCLKALRAYAELLHQTENPRVRFNVAKDVLDRTGVMSPPTP